MTHDSRQIQQVRITAQRVAERSAALNVLLESFGLGHEAPVGARCYCAGMSVTAGDDQGLAGLWDSSPFDYGVMESRRLGLLADGTGWGLWSNFGGGMELTLLTWRRLRIGVLEIAERKLVSGRWEAERRNRLIATEPPTLLNTRRQYPV